MSNYINIGNPWLLSGSRRQSTMKHGILILPHRVAAELPILDQDIIYVRVVDPEDEFLPLPIKPDRVLELKFHDIMEDLPEWKTITDEQAKEIALFFKKHHYINKLVVHCQAGISRSPAIAVAWARFKGNTEGENAVFNNPNFHPNGTVLHKVLKALSVWPYDRENDKTNTTEDK